MKQLTATELSAYLLENPATVVVDVREEDELVYGKIDQALHIPMQTIPGALEQLGDKESQDIVVVCHAGVRSQHVAQYLDGLGYLKVMNLLGGMNSWARDVDNTMSVY